MCDPMHLDLCDCPDWSLAVTPGSKQSGCWDSIHVFESEMKPGGRRAHYKLTSTVILSLGTYTENLGSMDLSGNMVRQVEQDLPVDDDAGNIANIGRVGHCCSKFGER